ncbi:hypothetical protein EDC30_107131 [Paucimonas lemoignei]|uniref:Uncharacterized protein n=2 Tax=Paucimonas lemoignei TaxID=29443 RepID=A0A4R3HUD5_PAULE|nr:hypothetical protein EDC30_107131 [Paucimonas lemoignei]
MAESNTPRSSADRPTPRAETSSEVSFSGNDGRHEVNGDVLEVRQGRLSVNGEYYGTVKSDSMIRYTVRGGQKKLTVDGKPRPLRK